MEAKLCTARSLVRRLSYPADEPSLAASIAELRLLSKHDPDIRASLADAGAAPLLAAQLVSASAPAASQEDAAAALLNLSISARDSLMSTPGLLDALGAALRLPNAAAQHAAAAIYSLVSDEAYRPFIGARRQLLSALVALLRAPPTASSVKDALRALFGVALYPPNRTTLVELGAVPALFSLVVRDGRRGVAEDASAVIAQVAGCGESVEAFGRVEGVRVLVDLMDPATGASERTRDNATAALLSLVSAGGEVAAASVREVEGVEKAARELAEGGVSARGKAKAEALLAALESTRGGEPEPMPVEPPSSSTQSSVDVWR